MRHVVISPGSRSQALAFAAYALSEGSSSTLDVHVSVDERTAGFLALGLTINSGVPSVLVCTSGSAPAHYLPALLEAKHSGLPLIVVSADRPDRLHGVGANQTSNHLDMFRSAAVSIKNVNLAEPHAPSGFEVATDSFRESVAGAVRGRS
ncbi:MAG: thiamine pyrophosphate-binding protein, partial [Pontimonas sp.]